LSNTDGAEACEDGDEMYVASEEGGIEPFVSDDNVQVISESGEDDEDANNDHGGESDGEDDDPEATKRYMEVRGKTGGVHKVTMCEYIMFWVVMLSDYSRKRKVMPLVTCGFATETMLVSSPRRMVLKRKQVPTAGYACQFSPFFLSLC
jgi:hypothetical protein